MRAKNCKRRHLCQARTYVIAWMLNEWLHDGINLRKDHLEENKYTMEDFLFHLVLELFQIVPANMFPM